VTDDLVAILVDQHNVDLFTRFNSHNWVNDPAVRDCHSIMRAENWKGQRLNVGRSTFNRTRNTITDHYDICAMWVHGLRSNYLETKEEQEEHYDHYEHNRYAKEELIVFHDSLLISVILAVQATALVLQFKLPAAVTRLCRGFSASGGFSLACR
jgi:hypothetical protein